MGFQGKPGPKKVPSGLYPTQNPAGGKMSAKTTQLKHTLIPKHTKVTETEKKSLLKKYHVNINELPKIHVKDPAIKHLKIKAGDLIRIERSSKVAGQLFFYRGVFDE